MAGDKILYPTGAASSIDAPFAAAITVDIWNNKNIVTVAQLTGNTTFNLEPEEGIRAGAEVSVLFTADGTNRVITMGGNILGAQVIVVANRRNSCDFEWDGSKFVLRSSIALL